MKEEYILTLIFPSFCREKILTNNIKSLKKLDNLKLIVVDDGSIPPYKDINFSNIILIRNKNNLGRGKSILKSLKLVDTEFVSIFDDEDKINISNLKKVISKLKKLETDFVGLVAETDQNKTKLESEFKSYLYQRFSKDWKDRKEFVRSKILKSSIPFWLKGRRIPTSFLFSLCDQKDKKWKYSPLLVVYKKYLEGGMTDKIKKNPFKKSILISVIYYMYRKARLIYEKN